MGSKWVALVDTWVLFEASYDYKGASQLPTSNRPVEVKYWVARGRASTCKPDINVAKSQASFWRWWIALQPDWRKIKPDNASRDIGGDWSVIDKPGTNGWPSIVAALFFWGRELKKTKKPMVSWDLAVEDATWVLEMICRARSA